MKKILSSFIVLSLLFVLLAGCANTAAPAGSVLPANASASAAKFTNPSDLYNAYIKVKLDTYKRINTKIEENNEMALIIGGAMSYITTADLSMVPITVVSIKDGAKALEILGLSGVKIDKNGNDYTVTYTAKDKMEVQKCKYDPETESLQVRITDAAGAELLFFECVKIGNGYVSQYYYGNSDGTNTRITSFINDTDIADFGLQSATAEPASIMGNNTLNNDFVKGSEMYFILQGSTMTIFEDGQTKTY